MDVPLEIDVLSAQRLLQDGAEGVLLDVREPFETAIVQVSGSILVPMRQLPAKIAELPTDRHLLVLCHHGGRSLLVTQYLRANGRPRASNVAGGIDAWSERCDPTLPRY